MSTTAMMQTGCRYCGCYGHVGMCPRIESIEYHPNGAIKKITLRASTPPGGDE